VTLHFNTLQLGSIFLTLVNRNNITNRPTLLNQKKYLLMLFNCPELT